MILQIYLEMKICVHKINKLLKVMCYVYQNNFVPQILCNDSVLYLVNLIPHSIFCLLKEQMCSGTLSLVWYHNCVKNSTQNAPLM